MLVHKVSLAEFAKLTGPVFAPTMLSTDMSDYVQVVKGDLIKMLRSHEITEVEYYRGGSDELVFIHGIEGS